MTNYERIKKMGIREMAMSPLCPADIDSEFKKPKDCKEESCYKCTLDWLRSEAKDER